MKTGEDIMCGGPNPQTEELLILGVTHTNAPVWPAWAWCRIPWATDEADAIITRYGAMLVFISWWLPPTSGHLEDYEDTLFINRLLDDGQMGANEEIMQIPNGSLDEVKATLPALLAEQLVL